MSNTPKAYAHTQAVYVPLCCTTQVALNERDHWSWEPGGNRLLVVERPRPQRATSPPRPLLQPAAEPSMAADGTALNGSSSSSNGNGVSAERTGRVAAAAAPVLEVVCEWGRAEAPSPALPASLQCGPLPGVLANGARVSALGAGAGVGLGGEAGGAPLIMANCQVRATATLLLPACARVPCAGAANHVPQVLRACGWTQYVASCTA